jgi:hypothetical protein
MTISDTTGMTAKCAKLMAAGAPKLESNRGKKATAKAIKISRELLTLPFCCLEEFR